MKLINKNSLVILATFAVTCSFAQTKDTLITKDIEIVKEYTPYLEDGKKQIFTPVMPKLNATKKQSQSYDVPNQFIQTSYQPDEIKPLPIDVEQEVEQTTIYLKAGYGNRNNPLAQVAISGAEKNNYSAGILGNFQAVKGKDIVDQKMHDAALKLFGTKALTTSTLKGDIHFKQQADALYGYNHAKGVLDAKDTKQAFTTIGALIGIESNLQDTNALQYDANLHFDNTNEKLYKGAENQVKLTGQVEKQLLDGIAAKVLVEAGMKNTAYKTPTTEKVNDHLLHATPIITPQFGNVNLELGASLNHDKTHEFKVFPHIAVEVPFSNDEFQFYASWKGKTELHGLQQQQDITTRIASSVRPHNYTKEVRTPLGLKGNVHPNVAVNLSVSQEISKNVQLFVAPLQDFSITSALSDQGSKFTALEESKLTNWKPRATVNYQLGKKVNAIADIAYNIYSTEQETNAFHLPDLDAKLNLTANPLKKLTLKSNINALTGLTNFDVLTAKENSLKSVIDLNLGAEYQLTKNIAIFIDGNNLANQKYQKWQNYPVVGTNILGGIVLSY